MPLKRPLEPLVLTSPYLTDAKFTFSKSPGLTSAIITENNGFANMLWWSPAEVRQIHTWLGDVIADMNAGV